MPSMNDDLLRAIQARQQKQTEFRYGIITADEYVRTLQDRIGLDACYRFAATRKTSFDDVLRKAARTLVYSNDDMEIERKSTKKIRGLDLPKNTLMAFRHTLTSSRVDRDGDILRSEGAEVDPKMLLLWQHVPTLPIGKMIKVHKQTRKRVEVVSAIVDMNELAHDAAVMVDNDMARFSHGFRPLDFEEIKGKGEDGPSGYDVKRFEVMEESMVSVPSNVDAETEEILLSLVEGGKLRSPLMKEYGRSVREHRPVTVPVKLRTTEITCNSLQELKQAHDLLGGNADEKSGTGGEEAGGKGGDVGTPKEADVDEKEKEGTGDAEVKIRDDKGIVPPNPSGGDGEGQAGEWSAPGLSSFTGESWDDLSGAERKKIASHFAWYPNLDSFGALKLPHHVKAGKASLNGVRNALARANQVTGVGDDLDRVMAHLRKHLKKEEDSMSVKEAMAVVLSEATEQERESLMRMLKAFQEGDEQKRKVDEYNALTGG